MSRYASSPADVHGRSSLPPGVPVRELLNLSQQILCVTDLAGNILWGNRGLEVLLGSGVDALKGRNLDDSAGPEEHFLGDLVMQSTRPGAPGSHPIEITGLAVLMVDGNGQKRTVDWTVRLDTDREMCFVAGRDVTNRVEDDAAARVAEEQLRGILAHAPAAIYVRDRAGQVLLANDQWRRVGDDSALRAIEGQVFSLGQPEQHDVRLPTIDGESDFMISLSPLLDDDGTAYALCGIATDITERTVAERSMRARELVLDTVLTASPDIISLMDSTGKIHQISAAEEAILGHRHEEPSDRDLFPLVHPEDFDEVASAFIRMVTGSVTKLHVRYRVVHAEGHWVTVDSRGQAVVDGAGRFLGAVVVSREITDRLELETKLESIRKAAEQASRAKSDFLSRMSHELRTPLNAILGFAQLLEMDDLPMQQADAVGHILRGGRHLLDLINEVLDIARIEAGRLDLALVPVDLEDLMDEVVELTRTMADRADISVRVTLDGPQGLSAMADHQRLVQVMLNLVSNAVKYNRTGGRVDVTCSLLGHDETSIRIAVADTGYGIRTDKLDRVFEPFDRLGVEQFGIEGTGIGLSLSRHLVNHMGGSIDFDSVPDVGSTFVVQLPVAALTEDSGTRRPRKQPADRAGSGFTVLLVEHDLASQSLVERVLSRRPGAHLVTATHGREAVDLARQHRPGLILLDSQLPDLSGPLVLERLDEDPDTCGIPVALLTDESHETQGQGRRQLGRSIAGHVAKPVDVRELLSLFDAVRATSAT